MVVRYDAASSFRSYVHSIGRARPSRSSYLFHLVSSSESEVLVKDLASYSAYTKVLLQNSTGREGDNIILRTSETQNTAACSSVTEFAAGNSSKSGSDIAWNSSGCPKAMPKPADAMCPSYYTPTGAKLSISSAMQLLNKYCAKLPSDTFTRLTVQWQVHQRGDLHCCVLALPINSPLKDVIVGPWLSSAVLAKHAAAFLCCVILHQIGELDDNLSPVGKESIQLEYHLCPPPATDLDPEAFPRPGTTKRRQYYFKKVAGCLLGGCEKALLNIPNEPTEEEPEVVVRLYIVSMVLRCAIPDQQNTRGRRIYRPESSNRDFGILTTHEISQTSAFPVFTRSGEVMVQLKAVKTSAECTSLRLTANQLESLNTFHQFTFTNVLRLEKYPIKFDPLKANSSFFIVPLISGNFWEFLRYISCSYSILAFEIIVSHNLFSTR